MEEQGGMPMRRQNRVGLVAIRGPKWAVAALCAAAAIIPVPSRFLPERVGEEPEGLQDGWAAEGRTGGNDPASYG